MIRTLSPHAVAYATRCKPDDLRNWRRSGFIDCYGERLGKSQLYAEQEVAAIAVALMLARAGMQMRTAFSFVRERTALFGELIQPSKPAKSDHVVTLTLDPDVSEGFSSITSAPLCAIASDDSVAGAIQINISHIVRDATSRLSFYESNLADREADAA